MEPIDKFKALIEQSIKDGTDRITDGFKYGDSLYSEIIFKAPNKPNEWFKNGRKITRSQYIKARLEYNTQRDIEFTRGYCCAVANLIRMYGEMNQAEEVYAANYHSVRILKQMGIDEHDIEILKPTIKELERKRKLPTKS